jgi:hypothetical protein
MQSFSFEPSRPPAMLRAGPDSIDQPGGMTVSKKLALLAASLIAVSGAAFALPAPQAPAATDPTAAARLKLAQKAFEESIVKTLDVLVAPPAGRPEDQGNIGERIFDGPKAERFYLWSRRWMEAASAQARTKADRVAAAQAHLDRMKGLEDGSLLKFWLKKVFAPQKGADAAKAGDGKPFAFNPQEAFGDMKPATGDYATFMEFFRLEAETLLAQAKAAPM